MRCLKSRWPKRGIWLSMIFSHPSNRDVTKTFHDSDPRLNIPSTSSANQKFILPPSQSQFFIVFQFLGHPIGEEDWQLTLERLVVLQFPEVSISDIYISIKLAKFIHPPPSSTVRPLKSQKGKDSLPTIPFSAPERPSGKDEGHPFAYVDARSGASCGE